jgi:ORF6N domain
MSPTATTLSPAAIAPKVHWIRHEKVILDFDLAALYGVETRVLNQAVKRNLDRFPDDFMFRLTFAEMNELRHQASQSVMRAQDTPPNSSQNVMSSRKHRGRSYLPYAFTEQGVAMLSSVLRSPRAVAVNIAIMRTFVQLRRLMDSNRDLARKIQALEQKYDQQFRAVFDAIKRLVGADAARKSRSHREIGFHVKN